MQEFRENDTFQPILNLWCSYSVEKSSLFDFCCEDYSSGKIVRKICHSPNWLWHPYEFQDKCLNICQHTLYLCYLYPQEMPTNNRHSTICVMRDTQHILHFLLRCQQHGTEWFVPSIIFHIVLLASAYAITHVNWHPKREKEVLVFHCQHSDFKHAMAKIKHIKYGEFV